MSAPTLALPSYREQSDAVRERFRRIYARPVILDVRSLDKTFPDPNAAGRDVHALHDLSLQIHRREFVCVIGPSGCGKSTFVRIVAGLEPHSGGELLIDGKPIEGPGADRGMVFQSYTLFPWLTILDNVMFGLRCTGREAADDEAKQWLDMVGLSAFAHAYPHQLSGGMKQRAAIVRALANRPRMLLMDEPFAALDAQTRARMQRHLLEIWRNVDVTVLFITHELDEAIYLADRIVVLGARPARLLEVIEVPLERPRSPEQFLSPEFLATRQRLDELIHPEKFAPSQATFHMPRMTVVGDDAE